VYYFFCILESQSCFIICSEFKKYLIIVGLRHGLTFFRFRIEFKTYVIIYLFNCDYDLCVIPINIIYIYKFIKEFLFLKDLCSTFKHKISLNILFGNLSNIFCSIIIMYTFFNYNFFKKKSYANFSI